MAAVVKKSVTLVSTQSIGDPASGKSHFCFLAFNFAKILSQTICFRFMGCVIEILDGGPFAFRNPYSMSGQANSTDSLDFRFSVEPIICQNGRPGLAWFFWSIRGLVSR